MNISANVSSLQANQTFLNTNANNIANVNTDGFRPSDTRISTNLQANNRLSDDTGSQKSQTDLSKEIPDQITIGGPFKNLCQSGKITNTQGKTHEDRSRCRAICSRY